MPRIRIDDDAHGKIEEATEKIDGTKSGLASEAIRRGIDEMSITIEYHDPLHDVSGYFKDWNEEFRDIMSNYRFEQKQAINELLLVVLPEFDMHMSNFSSTLKIILYLQGKKVGKVKIRKDRLKFRFRTPDVDGLEDRLEVNLIGDERHAIRTSSARRTISHESCVDHLENLVRDAKVEVLNSSIDDSES